MSQPRLAEEQQILQLSETTNSSLQKGFQIMIAISYSVASSPLKYPMVNIPKLWRLAAADEKQVVNKKMHRNSSVLACFLSAALPATSPIAFFKKPNGPHHHAGHAQEMKLFSYKSHNPCRREVARGGREATPSKTSKTEVLQTPSVIEVNLGEGVK